MVVGATVEHITRPERVGGDSRGVGRIKILEFKLYYESDWKDLHVLIYLLDLSSVSTIIY